MAASSGVGCFGIGALSGSPAVHGQDDAVDEAGARRQQEGHSPRDLTAGADATQGVASLMAEIEEGQSGDQGKAREWLARAVRAARDPAWTADGLVSDEWEPISPVTGRLDAFEWKVPMTLSVRQTPLASPQLPIEAPLPLAPASNPT